MVRIRKQATPVAVQQVDVAAQQVDPTTVPAAAVEAAPGNGTPVPAAGNAKYAPVASIDNMAAVIVAKPNPKKPSSKSYARYAKFYTPGQTVGGLIEAYKAANMPSNYARLDLRWDLAHGHITLVAPTGN